MRHGAQGLDGALPHLLGRPEPVTVFSTEELMVGKEALDATARVWGGAERTCPLGQVAQLRPVWRRVSQFGQRALEGRERVAGESRESFRHEQASGQGRPDPFAQTEPQVPVRQAVNIGEPRDVGVERLVVSWADRDGQPPQDRPHALAPLERARLALVVSTGRVSAA